MTFAVVLMLLAPAWLPAQAGTADVIATVETEPVPSSGDAADDPAIWIHPDDPSLSTIIGTDKQGGLAVYDLAGREIQYISGIRPNNVDLRYDFPLGGRLTDLVVSSERGDDVIAVFWVDPRSRRLVEAGTPIQTGMDVYGICMYQSPRTGAFFVFVTSEDEGPVRQWQLFDDGNGRVGARQVREFWMDSQAEGCVADDELSFLYVGEEEVAIWKYEAEPDGGAERVVVDRVGAQVEGDIEGLTIYYGPGGTGYLIASSQGSDEFAVYRREGANDYVTSFQLHDGPGIDGVTNTDGIDVLGLPMGPAFPAGVFVAQDDDNGSQNQNFKLVSWEDIARSTSPPLMIQGGKGASPVPLPDRRPARWTLVEFIVKGSGDDGELDTDGTVSAGTRLRMETGREVFLRFSGLDLPRGAIVRSAHVQFAAADEATAPLVLSIEGLLAPSDPVAGPRTPAVTWAPAGWSDPGLAGPYQRTPDLSAIFQRLVMGAEWVSGQSVTLVIRTEGEGHRSALSFEGGHAPVLRLEYTLDL